MEGLLCDFGLLFAVLSLGFGIWELGISGSAFVGLGAWEVSDLGFRIWGVWSLGSGMRWSRGVCQEGQSCC